MIMHLSAPTGQSINDHISKEQYSLQYSSVDDAVKILTALGKGALMAKVDLKSAFRVVPVHSTDWDLLGRGDFWLLSGCEGRRILFLLRISYHVAARIPRLCRGVSLALFRIESVVVAYEPAGAQLDFLGHPFAGWSPRHPWCQHT